mmetsp:Transcript_2964/g.11294  ORF Transcript_2964/g.11294 Transcript_2964/m.11294 type:complete len:343 (-) Transcript_2964:198-1226(-)
MPRDGVEVGPRGVVFAERVGDVRLDLAERGEIGTEGAPFARVDAHDVEAAPRDARRHRGQREALDLEVAHHRGGALVDRADEVLRGHAARLEDEVARRRGAHPELALDRAAQREAFEAALHHEEADRVARGARPRVHEEHVAEPFFFFFLVVVDDVGVGDPRLVPVEDPVRAVARRARAHPEDVGARRRLGHAHAADRRPVEGPREVAQSLLLRAVDVEIVREERGMREVRQREARIGVREFLGDDDRGDGVEPAAAGNALRRDRRPEHAELFAEFSQERRVRRLLRVMASRLRLEVVAREAPHERADGGVLGRRRQEAPAAVVFFFFFFRRVGHRCRRVLR